MSIPSILRQASGVVAILKPAGLATQSPPGIPSLERWLRGNLGHGDGGYLGVPHRLDRAVSGVVLMAATPRAARKLSRQFERRTITKRYLAVVEPRARGSSRAVEWPDSEWTDHLLKVPDEARCGVVDAATSGARAAITRARWLGRQPDEGRRVLLELEPLTGRMHQLRVQAASRGLPIVGDVLYGGPAIGGGDERERPILLHASRIAYDDPDSGERITIEAPTPDHWPEWAIMER